MKIAFVAAALGLSGCAASMAPQETVTVRLGEVSCSERIVELSQGSVAATVGSEISGLPNGVAGVTIRQPTGPTGAPQAKRCDRLLRAAEALAIAELEQTRAETAAVVAETRMDNLRADAEQLAMESAMAGVDTDW